LEKRKRYVKIAAVVLLLTMAMLLISTVKVKAENIPPIVDPTPGYYETSEYMIGNCSVSIIFLESNHTMDPCDPETENWTQPRKDEVLNKTLYALNWWSSRNPNASFSFYIENRTVQTRYEPINHNYTDRGLWIGQAMTSLGYPPSGAWIYQVCDYVNAFRDEHNTDWCFVMFIVDSFNSAEGNFPGGGAPSNDISGHYICMTYNNGQIGIDNMDKATAHEVGNIFWAADEYRDNTYIQGYLNVSNVPHSGYIMDTTPTALWGLSSGTWGQVGWRDNDTDGIQDIVDKPQNVYINSSTIIGNKIQYNGTAAVTTYINRNPLGSQRNVTINKIQSVQYRTSNTTWNTGWSDATITPWNVTRLIKYPNINETRPTYAIVNFTFQVDLTNLNLSPGNYTVEIKATNQWNISGYVSSTFCLNTVVSITNVAANSTVINVTVNNAGSSTVTTNVSVAWRRTDPTQNVTLPPGETTLNFVNWTTNPTGRYEITAVTDLVIIDSSVYIGFNKTTVSFGVGGSQASQSDSTSNWIVLAFCMLSASFIVPEFSKKKKPDDDLLTATEHTDSTENMWQNLARHQLT